MLQRLTIALAQVKAGNNSESLLNEIRKIVCSLYQSKQITKKVNNKYILKTYGEDIDKPSVQICVNKIENRVTFKIKNGYSLELLTPETMKLLGTTKNKITKDKNDENVPHLEITEVVLVHCNIVNNDYQQDSRVLYTFAPI